MLQSIQNQRVHIFNLGFEKKWLLSAFEKSRPDKTYLIKQKDENEKAVKAEKEIKQFLRKKGIVNEDVIANGDIYKLINQLRKIIKKESKNFIYLCISSGQRDNVSALILSSMLFCEGVKGIYLYSVKEGEFTPLPNFEIKLPPKAVIETIKYLATNENKATKKELRDYLFKNKILEISSTCKFPGHNEYVKLNRAVLDSAIEWKLITIEGKRKGSRIILTDEGAKWAKIFSD